MPRLRGRNEEPTNTSQNQLIPTKVERPPSPPPAKVYAFECGVVRLNERDFNRWKAAFPHLDLVAELTGLAGWASRTDNWFYAISSALAKRNREVGLKREDIHYRNQVASGVRSMV